MIKVRCRTSLDTHKGQVWPTKLACRPVIGDFVESYDGHRLKIHEIVHKQYPDERYEPSLIIELHN